MLKGVLIFVSGATIGGFLGYKFAEKKYNEQLIFEVNKAVDEAVKTKKKDDDKNSSNVKVEEKRQTEETKNTMVNYNSIVSHENYESDAKNKESGLEEVVREDYEHPEDEMDPSPNPYLIDADEFDNGAGPFEKLSMYYYRGNGVLVDDSDNVVDPDDADLLLGHGWEDYSNGGVVYIRNEKLQNDYELVVNDGSYPMT